MNNKNDVKNAVNGLLSGFIAPNVEKTTNTPPSVKKTPIDALKCENAKSIYGVSNKGTSKYKNGLNLNNNYSITFKIDADIEEYLKNIDLIAFIESSKSGKAESVTKTDLINNLIRLEMFKLIGANINDDAQTISDKWQEYKNKNHL